MKKNSLLKISRENHLDHMVKVVPFIVVGYALQSYAILQLSPGEFSQISLSILGASLALMIGLFITYDLKHEVALFEDHLIVSFFGQETKIHFSMIEKIEITHPQESFSHITLAYTEGKKTFYFIDQADKIKAFIEERSAVDLKAA